MIFMKSASGAQLTGANGHVYTADADGLISNVATCDIASLSEQGARTTTISALTHLKLFVTHALYFEGRTHHADGNGILRDVPRDHADPLIESGVAREATEDELVKAQRLGVTEIALVPLDQSVTGIPVVVVPAAEPAPVIEPPAAPAAPQSAAPEPAKPVSKTTPASKAR